MFAFDASNRLRPLGAMVDARATINLWSTQPDQGASVAIVDGRAVWRLGGAAIDGATVQVQGYPTLVDGGVVRVTGAHDTETVGRVAIGIDGAGRVVLCAATLPMLAFARWLLAAGIRFAVYLDGGSASALVSADGALSFGTSRALPSVVGFVVAAPATPAAPVSSGSSNNGLALALALLALAAARGRRR